MTAAGILCIITGTAGLIFMVISLIGIIRLPDYYTRLHAQGVGDTLGAFLIILSMLIATGLHLISIKMFLIFVIIMLTNPVGTNLIINAVINSGIYRDPVKAGKDDSAAPNATNDSEAHK